MSSAIVSGFGSTVSGMWRSHSVLPESDPESSPEAPQQFRKLRSSSSLNSLRMSLRKRLPLKTVQSTSNIMDDPNSEGFQNSKKTSTVTQMKRTAKNTLGNAYQKFQKSTLSREECLVRTPGAILEGEENECAPASARTPKRQVTTPRRTPRSTTKRIPRVVGTPEPSESAVRAVKTGGTRRQLVRMAALRSPFASPNSANRRRQFDQDLDSVSKGLKKLKRLSRAFDEVIGRDERTEAMEHYRRVLVQSYGSSADPGDVTGKLNRSFIQKQSRQIRQRVGSWTDGALSSLRKNTER